MRVRELVAGEVVWVAPEATLRQAAEVMVSAEVGSVAVAVDGALEGILTERDILRAVAGVADFDVDSASTWMTEYPESFTPEMEVDDAADWMLATGFRHLPLVDGGEVLGVISIKDVLWALTDEKR
ncbi:MAG TPA: CBS domain-containing protein [Acidimicrobiia bacterium]|jgi:CBS domain-containing protein|nr:histidine kinase [Acidimicrobiia bacterium]HYJ25967.1 CBS domain-containing protein [Acidimicrobiia bacterium]